jgi:clan AA aspartic protease
LDYSWKYSKEQEPPAPVLELSLQGISLELSVDTGFGGGVLIPFSFFQSLGLLSSLTPDSYHAIMPDSRRVLLYTARTEIQVRKIKLTADIHSSPLVNRKLAGRAFLKSFTAVLDGRKEEMRIIT